MSYKKTDARANFPEIEAEMSNFWAADKTFHKRRTKNATGKTFRFFDGPATPSSIPHIGHLGVSAVKDMVCRYRWMLGDNVIHKLGWDVHGLPTEVMVEKETGKQSKELVAEYGIEKFCDMCRDGVMKYVDEWGVFLKRMGRWVDIGDGDVVYNTMYPTYMESVIWALKKLYDDGFIYKDFKVNPFDWKLGTVMSNSEASSEYQDVIDDAVTVWFEMADGRRILAWTTTPWTLPGNLALAVNPGMEYSILFDKKEGVSYIVAKNRLKAYDKQLADLEQIGIIHGDKLVGEKYKPLFPYYETHEDRAKLYQIIAADYVSDTDGTGTVHIAPAFGEEDYQALKAMDPKFPVIVNVDDYGNFDETVADWAGVNIFDANPKIMEYLKNTGHLVKKEQLKHSYPFSPRTKVKLIYRASPAWYIDVPKIRDNLIAQNAKVDWKSAGARFSAWIGGARPWGISRNRFWGVPLPIWARQSEGGERRAESEVDYKFFGSIAEMEDFFGVKITDLHRPTLDKLERDGWKRIPDVLDAWFESGSMPFASEHYPFDPSSVGDAAVDNPNYMSDYIIEGQDQTRGWFYTLMVLSTALFDRPAFKTINANGMTVDDHKKKMSKSLGNYVNPTDILNTYGADAIRLYILGSNFIKAEPVPIDKEGKVFAETVKNILTPLWNAYHFFTLYANAGNITAVNITYTELNIKNVLDKYILAELRELNKIVYDSLNEYKPDVAIRAFTSFLEILNNWYIRRSRERFWDEEQGAFDTLYTVLTTVCKLMAPLAPFVTDYIYRNLTKNESVHLESFPGIDLLSHDEIVKSVRQSIDILEPMRKVQSIIAVGKSLREQNGLRNRLPLQSVKIAGWEHAHFKDIIKDELNVKSVQFIANVNQVADSFIFPITPKIGARLGSALKEIIPAIKAGKYEIKDGELLVQLNAELCTLHSDEFETRLTVKPGITGAALPDNTAVVVLNTDVTPDLAAEGLARDALRFIQDTRKEMDLDVSDRIRLNFVADADLARAIGDHAALIRDNALIDNNMLMEQKIEKDIDFETVIEGHPFGIKITKIA